MRPPRSKRAPPPHLREPQVYLSALAIVHGGGEAKGAGDTSDGGNLAFRSLDWRLRRMLRAAGFGDKSLRVYLNTGELVRFASSYRPIEAAAKRAREVAANKTQQQQQQQQISRTSISGSLERLQSDPWGWKPEARAGSTDDVGASGLVRREEEGPLRWGGAWVRGSEDSGGGDGGTLLPGQEDGVAAKSAAARGGQSVNDEDAGAGEGDMKYERYTTRPGATASLTILKAPRRDAPVVAVLPYGPNVRVGGRLTQTAFEVDRVRTDAGSPQVFLHLASGQGWLCQRDPADLGAVRLKRARPTPGVKRLLEIPLATIADELRRGFLYSKVRVEMYWRLANALLRWKSTRCTLFPAERRGLEQAQLHIHCVSLVLLGALSQRVPSGHRAGEALKRATEDAVNQINRVVVSHRFQWLGRPYRSIDVLDAPAKEAFLQELSRIRVAHAKVGEELGRPSMQGEQKQREAKQVSVSFDLSHPNLLKGKDTVIQIMEPEPPQQTGSQGFVRLSPPEGASMSPPARTLDEKHAGATGSGPGSGLLPLQPELRLRINSPQAAAPSRSGAEQLRSIKVDHQQGGGSSSSGTSVTLSPTPSTSRSRGGGVLVPASQSLSRGGGVAGVHPSPQRLLVPQPLSAREDDALSQVVQAAELAAAKDQAAAREFELGVKALRRDTGDQRRDGSGKGGSASDQATQRAGKQHGGGLAAAVSSSNDVDEAAA